MPKNSAKRRMSSPRHDIKRQAIKKVSAKISSGYTIRQVLVGRGDQPGVDLNECLTTHSLELPILDDPQHSLLSGEWQVA